MKKLSLNLRFNRSIYCQGLNNNFRLIIILLINFLLASVSFSQEMAIKISNQNSQKEIVIKENIRIRVKTFDGKKLSGKFQIIDKNTILIKDKIINLSDIEKIKRNPFVLHIVTGYFLIYTGVLVTVFIYHLTFSTPAPALIALLTGFPATIYGVAKSPNILKAYKTSKKWSFEIVTLE